MTFIPASEVSIGGFLAVVAWVILTLMAGVYFSSEPRVRFRKTLLFCIGSMVWLGIVSAVVRSGFLEAAPLPRVVIFMGLSNLMGAFLAASSWGGAIARRIPIGFILAFQGFRFPLEMVLHSWGMQGTIPMSMTWEGSNYDVISGVLALICAPLSGRYRWTAWIANAVGFVLLVNVARVAILSSPFPFGWQVTPPLLLAFYLPYAWIVPICVAGALSGHIILTRALLRKI